MRRSQLDLPSLSNPLADRRIAACGTPSAPEIVQLYALNVPAYTIRAKVREMFEKNSNVSDPEAVDILLLKGYQEFQEVSGRAMIRNVGRG